MMGMDRSQKAKAIIESDYSDTHEAKAVGVSPMASTPVTPESIIWADKIICMDANHLSVLLNYFPGAESKVAGVWNIAGHYGFDNPELENILREKIEELV